MLNRLYREYVALVAELLDEPEAQVKDDRLIVGRAHLIERMNRLPYLTGRNKIAAWRDLRWIDCEEGRSRKRVRVGDKLLSVIQIDLSVFRQLRQLEPELLEKLYREYLALAMALWRQPNPWIKNHRLIIERRKLDKLLDQHPYLSSRQKVNIWRRLHWIVSQGDRSRKQIRDADGATISAIQIDLVVVRRLADCKAETDADRAKKAAAANG